MAGQLRPDYQQGACRVNAAGTFAFNDGVFRSIARTGVGVYELTVFPVAQNECTFSHQVLSALVEDVGINVEYVSQTLIRCRGIRTVAAAALADLDYFFEIHKARTGT